MSEYVLVSCEVTSEVGSESFKTSENQGDDQVICYVNIIAHLHTYGDTEDHYAVVEGWPRQHMCALKIENLLDKEKVKAILRSGKIPVDAEMVEDIVDCAREMACKDSNGNKKVQCMKVEVFFFDGELVETDSDSDESDMVDDATEEMVE
ncbi:hypothetical protein ACFE04_004806 [Oxalis oulophora]